MNLRDLDGYGDIHNLQFPNTVKQERCLSSIDNHAFLLTSSGYDCITDVRVSSDKELESVSLQIAFSELYTKYNTQSAVFDEVSVATPLICPRFNDYSVRVIPQYPDTSVIVEYTRCGFNDRLCKSFWQVPNVFVDLKDNMRIECTHHRACVKVIYPM